MTADHDTLRRLVAEATPGPWHTVDRIWLPRDGNTYVIAGHHDPHVGRFVCDVGQVEEWDEENTREAQFDQKEADAALIVASRNALPGLLDEIARLRKVAEAARTALESPNDWLTRVNRARAVIVAALRDWRGA